MWGVSQCLHVISYMCRNAGLLYARQLSVVLPTSFLGCKQALPQLPTCTESCPIHLRCCQAQDGSILPRVIHRDRWALGGSALISSTHPLFSSTMRVVCCVVTHSCAPIPRAKCCRHPGPDQSGRCHCLAYLSDLRPDHEECLHGAGE